MKEAAEKKLQRSAEKERRKTVRAAELDAKRAEAAKAKQLAAAEDSGDDVSPRTAAAEFQADTARLVKVDLPAVAAAAASRGADTVKATATLLGEEIEALAHTSRLGGLLDADPHWASTGGPEGVCMIMAGVRALP